MSKKEMQEKIKKIAHQIGTQGYALMNDRAFCNCQKKKMETKESHHEAWFDCWEEYKTAYNEDPDKWLEKYISIVDDKALIKGSETIKNMIKANLVNDVETVKGDSEYVGATIRNVLRHYAKEELKEKIKEINNSK
jgi:hypothetical protein